jgi:hypothetical protein
VTGREATCSRASCEQPARYRFRFACERGHTNEPVRCVEHTAEDRAYTGSWCCSTREATGLGFCPASSRIVQVSDV